MPILRLIDTVDNAPTEGPFAIAPDVHRHIVAGRVEAYQVLKADLRATANRAWSDDILAAFKAGEDVITRPNGVGHSFTVQFEG